MEEVAQNDVECCLEVSAMMVVLDRNRIESILEERRALGNRTRDEVWEGVTYIMPDPNNEHQDIAGSFLAIFKLLFGFDTRHRAEGTPNLSDRIENWTENYRNPDMAYFAADTAAEDHDTFWFGGPEFLLEIISPDDMSRDKLPFYEAIRTREVLIVDRDPRQLELYQLRRGKLRLAGSVRPGDGKSLASGVVPLTFALVRGRPRPKIRVTHSETEQEWTF
jgi:Uma2 family endonuclease